MSQRSRTIIIKVVLPSVLVAGIVLARKTSLLGWLQSRISRTAAPIATAGSGLSRNISKLAGGNSSAEERYADMAGVRMIIEDLREKNRRLEHALGFQEHQGINMKGAHVLLFSREFGEELLVIDQGKNGGVETGNIVITANGVFVGTIKEVARDTAKVDIASNPDQMHEVRILPLDLRVFAKGIGNRTFELTLVPHDAPLAVGDMILAGDETASFYAMGEVSTVSEATTGAFKEVAATMLAHPDQLEEVFVVQKTMNSQH